MADPEKKPDPAADPRGLTPEQLKRDRFTQSTPMVPGGADEGFDFDAEFPPDE